MKTAKFSWRTVPRKSLIGFLLGVFFIFSTIAFTNDIIDVAREPTVRVMFSFFLAGLFAVSYALAGFILREHFWKAFLPIFTVQFVMMGFIASRFPNVAQTLPMGAADISRLRGRLTFDGVATIIAVALGYACFVHFSITEGKRYFRVHAEMLLATEIHRVLVPAIDTKIGGFDFHGRSLPSGEVGGDLIDVVQSDRGWIAYIADVSGHGIAPGVVMGMVKSAARMQLSSTETSAELLEHLNSVLYPIKKPEMFVTFAYLAWNGEQLEYSVAGHPPLLHYHAATKEISEVACSNLPLAMFAGQQFIVGAVRCAAEDIFLLITDGVLEVTNVHADEFGLAGIKSILSVHALSPANVIIEAVFDGVRSHGQAADDQSLLLVRCHRDSA